MDERLSRALRRGINSYEDLFALERLVKQCGELPIIYEKKWENRLQDIPLYGKRVILPGEIRWNFRLHNRWGPCKFFLHLQMDHLKDVLFRNACSECRDVDSQIRTLIRKDYNEARLQYYYRLAQRLSSALPVIQQTNNTAWIKNLKN